MKPLFLMIALLLASTWNAAAGPAKKTVLDYYLDLPDDAFCCGVKPNDLSRGFKKGLIKKQNIRDGYILADAENSPLEVALFRDRHLGITVVAVNRQAGRGSMCRYFRLMRPLEGGGWAEFTSFPSADEITAALGGGDVDFDLALPESGTDIRVVDPGNRKILLLIKWSGGEFHLKKR